MKKKFLLRDRKLGQRVHRLFHKACRRLEDRRGLWLVVPGIRISLTAYTQYAGAISLQVGLGRQHQEKHYPWYGSADLKVDFDRCWHNCHYAEVDLTHKHWGVVNDWWHGGLDAAKRREVIAERS